MGKATSCGRAKAAAASAVVTRVRPACPAGHSPSASAGAERSSSTTSHGLLVSASQPTKRAATVSASPAGSMPMTAAAAAA